MGAENMQGVEKALAFVKNEKIAWLDLQFTDILGKLQHVTVPAGDLDAKAFEHGFGKLDGSSIKGFTGIYESDLVLVPIPETLVRIPWSEEIGVARALNRVYWGGNKGRFEKDPRFIAEEAEKYEKSLGYSSRYGMELEFFAFDSIKLDVATPQKGLSYEISAREAPWQNTGSYLTRYKEGYYPAPPVDKLMDLRTGISDMLKNKFGFEIEAFHHEVATAGQSEINFRYSTLVDSGDRMQTLKYVVKNFAAKQGMVATFMPKPMYGDNGSGMHVSFSLWDTDGKKNKTYDPNDNYAEISQEGRYAVGGILKHARALSAIVSPTVNSYHRLIPGFEAPVYTAWAKANRSAIVRVPSYFKGEEKTKRIEYRAPDPSANPYLVFPAVLMAALDGIKKKIDPGNPVDEDIYHLSEEKRKSLNVGSVPRSLTEALDELENDRAFLKPVFNDSILNEFIELKKAEARTLAQYPHPIEFYYYMDA